MHLLLTAVFAVLTGPAAAFATPADRGPLFDEVRLQPQDPHALADGPPAITEVRESDPRPAYEVLAGLFEAAAGSVPDDGEIAGWTAGRCFASDDRDGIHGALLMGRLGIIGGDRGPLFPQTSQLEACVLFKPDAADYFDQVDEARANEAIAAAKNNFNPALRQNGELTAQFPIDQRMTFRRGPHGYILLQHDVSGKAKSYCYFFKRGPLLINAPLPKHH